MTIRSFDLLQPRSLQEAVELLQKYGDESRPIAGGTTLVILMKQRALHYKYLVDLQSIPGLSQIAHESDGVLIGALVTADGRSNWFKGVQLVAVYLIIALMFYFIPVQ